MHLCALYGKFHADIKTQREGHPLARDIRHTGRYSIRIHPMKQNLSVDPL